MLGYPEAALADTHKLLSEAREIDQAATLMFALFYASIIHIYCGNYAATNPQLDEIVALADEKVPCFGRRSERFGEVGFSHSTAKPRTRCK
jgi:hypothetical protein